MSGFIELAQLSNAYLHNVITIVLLRYLTQGLKTDKTNRLLTSFSNPVFE